MREQRRRGSPRDPQRKTESDRAHANETERAWENRDTERHTKDREGRIQERRNETEREVTRDCEMTNRVDREFDREITHVREQPKRQEVKGQWGPETDL